IWICVDDGDGSCPEWAVPYEEAATPAVAVDVPWPRSPDDIFFLYTGGTTGMPKAVMWRQDDVMRILGAGGNVFLGEPACEGMDDYKTRVGAATQTPVQVPACPLMHGTGLFTAYQTLVLGGTVVLLT